MADKTANSFDEFINRQRRLLSAAEQIKNLMMEFPELSGMTVNGSFAAPQSPSIHDQPIESGKRTTRYQAIRQFFITHSNSWKTASDLANELRLSKSAVTQVLWILNKDAFEKRDVAGSRKKKEFRLKGP